MDEFTQIAFGEQTPEYTEEQYRADVEAMQADLEGLPGWTPDEIELQERAAFVVDVDAVREVLNGEAA